MIAHAAALSSSGVLPTTSVVVLATKNESNLLQLEKRLQYEQIPFVAFREPDRNNELMSIGIFPVEDRRMVRRLLRDYPILEELCSIS